MLMKTLLDALKVGRTSLDSQWTFLHNSDADRGMIDSQERSIGIFAHTAHIRLLTTVDRMDQGQ